MTTVAAPLTVVIAEDEPSSRARLRQLLAPHADVVVAAECGTGEQTVRALRRLRPHVLFLDVQMPGFDGFTALQESGVRVPAIVFVTAFDTHAIRAFDVQAVDYLLKPFDDERFERALAGARRRVQGIGPAVPAPVALPARFAVRDGGGLHFLDLDAITHVTAEDCYSRIHAGSRTYLVRESLSSLEGRLPRGRFRRIHRSAILNLTAVRSIAPLTHGDQEVDLGFGVRLRVSRRYRLALAREIATR